ncbi:TIGR04282 family arsenosugar biosynthesis glycosyltransferase [Arhodomonas sp. SL1]|uniref:TIGR04282 family arsenosugar biosynthesis glycosyltransferase n=1 Tax=Arhodomonas sp. SL1 TaxID=3425691 RepID=UPI003F88534B
MRRLLIFAKPPVAGRVKTRLARRIGQRAALAAYHSLLHDTLARLAGAGLATEVELWGDGGRHPGLTRLAVRHGARFRPQGQGDLGRRMHRALATALASGRLPVLVGADCGGITPGHVADAFHALESGFPAVFAPAEDGGYALVGIRGPMPSIFRGIPWGGQRVMACTRRRLVRGGYRWRELSAAWDVDDPADLRRWRHRRGRGALGGVSPRRYP